MDEEYTAHETTQTPETKQDVIKRWVGLILCTLILIGSAILAAQGIKRALVKNVVYDEVVYMDPQTLYGAWRFAGIDHQYAGDTRTLEGAEAAYAGTVYNITESLFMASGAQEWSVSNPKYVIHSLIEEAPTCEFDDVRAWMGDELLGYYAVLSAGGTVQPYRIYFSRDSYWLAEFRDTDGRTVILGDLCRIEKTE